ncbi:hypothetical protein C4Y11_28295, partial [Escherichia coli]
VTTLDIIRSNTFVAELKGKQPGEVEVPVIGGHSGVNILPLLSQVPGVRFSEPEGADLAQRLQDAGPGVGERKGGGRGCSPATGLRFNHFSPRVLDAFGQISHFLLGKTNARNL